MAGIAKTDVTRLARIVGSTTLARGRRYAQAGLVARFEWDAAGSHVVGEVRGSAPTPYRVSVRVERSRRAELAAIEGRCTCPVARNCKHAVAVLLAGASAPPAVVQTPADAPSPAAWERALSALVESRPAPTDAPPGALGLQFELVVARPGPSRAVGQGGPGLRLRPLTRSTTGRFVATGVNWSRIDVLAAGHGAPPRIAGQARLLRELRMLHALASGRAYYGYGEDTIWLEAVPTRRLWDLLAQAEELAIPLLRAGRGAEPVVLERTPVQAALDVTRRRSGLVVQPALLAGGGAIDPTAALLIGRPAHGVAWWRPGAADGAGLHLAPLERAVDAALGNLIAAGPLAVPAADAERLLRDLYPALRRRVSFVSSDHSVDLPAPAADELVLRLVWAPGPRAALSWALVAGGAARSADDEADAPADAARRAATALLARAPGLVATGGRGPQLASPVELCGLDAARFACDLLPELAVIPALRVEESGDRPAFQEATDVPVVRLAGEETPDGDWLDLAVEVRVGDEEVPFHELFVALAEGASHLLLPSGTYFSLERPELARLAELIAEARALNDSPRATARLSRYQASLWEDLSSLGASQAEIGAWTTAVGALVGDDPTERPLPAGLEATLRPYQVTGFQWLAARYEHRLGGILADDMGLGKTLQALALVCHARERGELHQPFLVVAPTSVVSNWVSEAARFAPGLSVRAITQTTRRRGVSLEEAVAGVGLVVTSYALLRIDAEEYAAQAWAGLLLDEAQFAKNPATQLHRCARRLSAPFKLALTGTPLENSLAELWALSAITAPGLFPRAERFTEEYRTPIERHRDEERLARLRRRLRPVMLRRRKEEVAADLPDRQEQVVTLELHPRHAKVYETYLQRERQRILGLLGDLDQNRFEILRSLTVLRQAALDVSLVDPTHEAVPCAKLDALGEMLEEIAADGHRAIVFSQFTRFLAAARARATAAGLDSCYLDGRTTRRGEVIDRFRAGAAPVFFISLKAGGFGLNLTEADYCVLLDPWWNPAAEQQAIDRIHRIGQTRKVLVYRLVAAGTIEEKVMALKQRKAQLFASVVDGGGFASAALTPEDVRALLS